MAHKKRKPHLAYANTVRRKPELDGKDARMAAYGDKPEPDLKDGIAPELVGQTERLDAMEELGRLDEDLHDGVEPELVGQAERLAAMAAPVKGKKD